MTVEIWSDVMCPFCYIGKRRFEQALDQFDHKNEVAVNWKSFQLDPTTQTDPDTNIHEFLAARKGISLEQARAMNDRVTQMAAEVGLTYNFDKAVVANSFDAHRLSHLAKKYGLQDEAEERLFAAYFTEGKNTADCNTLVQLGSEIGLDPEEVRRTLNSNEFAEEVRRDIYEAQQVGLRGVPHFVINDKYAISGAQSPALFLEALNKIWIEFKNSDLPASSSEEAKQGKNIPSL